VRRSRLVANFRHPHIPVAADLPVCVCLALPGSLLLPFPFPVRRFPPSSLPLPTMRPAPVRVCAFLSLLFSSLLVGHVSAQSTSAPANSTVASSSPPSSTQTQTQTQTPTPSLNLTTFLATSYYTTTSASLSGSQDIPFTTVVPVVYNVTSTLPTPTASTTASSSPTPTPIVLATEISPAFGVLGAILILTGLPSAFWGHKNRWCAISSTPHIQSLNLGPSGLRSSSLDFIPCRSFASFSSSNLASSQQ
jgi:hypothetical protein